MDARRLQPFRKKRRISGIVGPFLRKNENALGRHTGMDAKRLQKEFPKNRPISRLSQVYSLRKNVGSQIGQSRHVG